MIPEAAVEAAKSAIWDLTGAPVPFEWQRDIIARAALEAAAPHMLAEAWESGASAQAAAYGMEKDTGPNPYRSATHGND